MKKTLAAFALACLLVGGACITEGTAVLYVVVNTAVPDTTKNMRIKTMFRNRCRECHQITPTAATSPRNPPLD